MRILAALIVAVVSLALAGCYVQTVHPLYTEDKLTFDPGLAGTWSDANEPGEPTLIEAVDESAYKVTFKEKSGDIEYEGHLVRLGESVYLDMCPAEARRQRATDDFMPLHVLLWIQRDGDELRVAGIDFEWLEKMIEANEIDIDHFRYDGRIILSEEAMKLQQSVMSLARTEGAFEEPSVLLRVK
jgi:hypothetical protein